MAAAVQLLLGQCDGEFSFDTVNGDLISLPNESDGAAHLGFRCDMTDDKAVGTTGETTVSDQSHLFPSPFPTRIPVMESISGMPGPPLGPS